MQGGSKPHFPLTPSYDDNNNKTVWPRQTPRTDVNWKPRRSVFGKKMPVDVLQKKYKRSSPKLLLNSCATPTNGGLSRAIGSAKLLCHAHEMVG